MKRFFAIILTAAFLAILLPVFSYTNTYAYTDATVKNLEIGLYYGDSSLSSANLQNVTGYGSGYYFGRVDNREFTSFGYTSHVYLTTSPDTSYHIALNGTYCTYDEAASAAAMTEGAFPVYDSGQFVVWFGTYQSYSAAIDNSAYCNGYAVTPGAGTLIIRDTQTGETLFAFDMPDARFAISPASQTGEKTQTWFKNYKYNGAFEYIASGGKVSVINLVDIEDYVRGVITYEMSNSWPAEALKAQAICARTYASSNLGKHSAYGFDLCNTTDCQVYRGTNASNEASNAAVTATEGMYLTYQGQLITAYYFSSDGGATEDSENVWNDVLPYCRAIYDEYESLASPTYSEWEYEITLSQITAILKARGNNITGSVVNAYAQYTNAGNVKSLTFVDTAGTTYVFSGEKARTLFNTSSSGINVRSQRFVFEDKENPRVTSCNQIMSISSNSSSSYQNADLSSSNRISSSGTGRMTGGTVPVITSSGLSYVSGVSVISGGGTFTLGTGSVSAGSLAIPTYSSGTYIISGSGYGHNVGMSQYGAKAMAQLGYTYQQILAYYYTGVNLTYIP